MLCLPPAEGVSLLCLDESSTGMLMQIQSSNISVMPDVLHACNYWGATRPCSLLLSLRNNCPLQQVSEEAGMPHIKA